MGGYGIVFGATLTLMSEGVNERIGEGYEPVGAPFFASAELGKGWHQAMYRQPVENFSIDTSFDGSKVTWLPVDINEGKDA